MGYPQAVASPADSPWQRAQRWESEWWGDCVNTYSEETKQQYYAEYMEIERSYEDSTKWPVYTARGKSVIDFGGGPVSLLLKTVEVTNPVVVDPCEFPDWVYHRYASAGITVMRVPAEEFESHYVWDEVWMYNLLEHVSDPERVARAVRSFAPVIRIFEWLNTATNDGHLHSIQPNEMIRMFGCGHISEIYRGKSSVGSAFYGVLST